MIIVVTTTGGEVVDQPIPPRPRPLPRPRLSATWTSWTGESWEITDRRSPVYALQGASGLFGTDPAHRWSESPTLDGATWDGVRTPAGEVFMPIRVDGPDLDTFLATHEAFIRSLDPTRVGWLRLTRPDGRWRQIGCRYSSGGDAVMELDPVMTRRATYGITWATADPYWQGEPVTVTFAYYSGSAARYPMRYPYRLAPTESLGRARVTNPGNVDAFPVWRVSGPFDAFSVGVGSSLVSMTLAKAAGEWVEINMHPTKLTIYDETGADLALDADEAVFSHIPPGDPVDLTTELVGAGEGASVRLEFTPRYRRAF